MDQREVPETTGVIVMVLTVLEANVEPGKEAALQSAYERAVEGALPPGLVRTELLRDSREPTRWRIQTLWESREVLEAMRKTGTPAGVLMFRAADAEPTLSIFEVIRSLAQ